jgi:quinol monooxygenase YgiN
MYGQIGKVLARPGRRDELVQLLLESSRDMPGCRSYVVARDPVDPDGIWVTEVWDSAESHAASLSLPLVRRAIERSRRLIAGFGERVETEPVGGEGLRGRYWAA